MRSLPAPPSALKRSPATALKCDRHQYRHLLSNGPCPTTALRNAIIAGTTNPRQFISASTTTLTNAIIARTTICSQLSCLDHLAENDRLLQHHWRARCRCLFLSERCDRCLLCQSHEAHRLHGYPLGEYDRRRECQHQRFRVNLFWATTTGEEPTGPPMTGGRTSSWTTCNGWKHTDRITNSGW